MDAASVIDDILAHHGVKGQKWGVRRKNLSKEGPSEDSTRVKEHLTKAKTSGAHSLSNKELQEVITRMNLEQQHSNLKAKNSTVTKGKKAVAALLAAGVTVNQVIAFANSPAGKALRTKLG